MFTLINRAVEIILGQLFRYYKHTWRMQNFLISGGNQLEAIQKHFPKVFYRLRFMWGY